MSKTHYFNSVVFHLAYISNSVEPMSKTHRAIIHRHHISHLLQPPLPHPSSWSVHLDKFCLSRRSFRLSFNVFIHWFSSCYKHAF